MGWCVVIGLRAVTGSLGFASFRSEGVTSS